MAPPFKKMRIVPPTEDEEINSESAARENNSWAARLQKQFEAIGDKYGKIPESMTDEIDMKTGQIVVDRGHMRKWNRDYVKKQGKRLDLVDDLFLNEAAVSEEEEDSDGENDDERDELAPSEPPEPRTTNQNAKEKDIQEAVATSHLNMPGALPPLGEQSPSTPAGVIGTSDARAVVSNISVPATNWMQLVQALQTPVGQQAQSDPLQQEQARTLFIQQIEQQIQQHIQQAITPLVSSLCSAIVPPQGANASPVVSYSAGAGITNRALQFPAPQSTSPPLICNDQPALPSTPLPVTTSCPRRKRVIAKGVYVRSRRCRLPLPDLQHNDLPKLGQQPEESTLGGEERNSDDDAQAELVEKIPQQKDSKVALEHIRDTKAGTHARNVTKKKRRPEKIKGNISTATDSHDLRTSAPPLSPHLPTPSSLEHEELRPLDDHHEEPLADGVEDLIASGGHFDDDERDLLSLHGEDDSEVIWPSIELEPQEDLDTTSNHSLTIPIRDKTILEVKGQSPIIHNVLGGKLASYQLDPDSEDGLYLNADSPSTAALPNHTTTSKPKRKRPQIDEFVEYPLPQLNHHPTSPQVDKPLPPVTPRIKRESLTPDLLTTPALHTPLSAPQPTTLTSSDTKPRSTPMPRSAYLQKVKRAWATGRSKSIFSPRALAKAKSLQVSRRKRAREIEDEEDSADELGC